MLVDAQLRRVAILGGSHVPFTRSNTTYATASNRQVLTATLQGLIDHFNLYGQCLDEVVADTVIKHVHGFNLARETMLSTTFAKQTPTHGIQQAYGTGLEAATLVANRTALGQIDVGIAGDTDTTSDTPVGLSEEMRKILLETNRAKSTGARVKALAGLRPSMFMRPLLPHNSEPRTGLSMGGYRELMVKRWGIRHEDQGALTLHNHHNLAVAYERGFFVDLTTAHLGLDRDNNLHSNLTIEQLAKLQPVFNRNAAGTMTAGNSTPLTDGASYVLLASEDWARTHNLLMLAYMTCTDTAAVDFFSSTPEQDEGLLVAPAYAVSRMLQHARFTLQDFGYYEIHEASAAQMFSMLAAWESPEYCREKLGRSAPTNSIDHSKLNVNGSSLGTGHPFATTGGRIATTLTKMLAQRGSGRRLVSICAAGGQSAVAIPERFETMSHQTAQAKTGTARVYQDSEIRAAHDKTTPRFS